ncbi:cytochrome P450 monooxygenase monooxygenase [Fusarium phyllophilum]|uniref:Cytochrome P450 monooxygenase monooxygenase n=1 Tax=Fusarium phyllophilum TaxID=47803 RepID=A0A8H5K9V9_9HYPO|nr:cytochrome P450 monooxygenase monooxygenase [Fusarium phyllophilum]
MPLILSITSSGTGPVLLTLFALAAVVILSIYRVIKYRHIPGPWLCRISHHYVTLFDLFRQRPQTVAKWHRQYGPFVQIAPGQVSVSDVTAMRDLYCTSARNPKSDYFDNFLYHNARAIFAEKEYLGHREKRGLVSSFFQATSVYKPDVQQPLRARALAAMMRIHEEIIASGQGVVDVLPIINHYAWDNTTALVFGPCHSSQALQGDENDRDLLARLKNSEMWGAVKYNLPIVFSAIKLAVAVCTRSTKYFSAEDELDKWAMQRLYQTKSDPKVSQDERSIVQIIQHLRHNGRSLSDNYLESEVIDNLYAGQATVTVALTYAVYHLSRNPHWQSMVQRELDGLPCDSDGLPNWALLNKAPVLEACIRESYRLNPVASGRAERVLARDSRYGEIFIPQNTIVSASTIALHLDPQVWTNPRKFNPRRWLDATSDEILRLERSFIPFGYGARLCLGKAFANLQIKMFMAAIYSKYNTGLEIAGQTMDQWGTQDALPKGLKCRLRFEERK